MIKLKDTQFIQQCKGDSESFIQKSVEKFQNLKKIFARTKNPDFKFLSE